MKLTKADIVLVEAVIGDFLYKHDFAKKYITEDGIKRLVEMSIEMASKLIPLATFPKEDIAKMQQEAIERLSPTK